MQKLHDYLLLIDAEIKASLQQLPAELMVAELSSPIEYILSLDGKRLRPALALLATNLYTEQLQHAVRPAIALEVFHNFTLLHDDIMDKAPLRRGQATVHTKWNQNIAILAGDAMLIKAYDFLDQLPPAQFQEVFRLFNRTAMEVCIGQQMDMNFESRHRVSIDEYIEMIRLKTSVLIAASLQIGGILGGASPADQQALYQFGIQLGISFQIHDDILDLYADQELFGKAVGGDIVANKKTFLLIKAQELAHGPLRHELDYWLETPQFDPQEKIQAVKNIYHELQIRQITEQLREDYYHRALQTVQQITLPEAQKQPLLQFAHWLMHRKR